MLPLFVCIGLKVSKELYKQRAHVTSKGLVLFCLLRSQYLIIERTQRERIYKNSDMRRIWINYLKH